MRTISKAEHRVIGFLVAKGLLFAPRATPMPMVKLTPREVLAVAENIEPRVYEVLPAALIHFPKSFLSVDSYPTDILEAVRAVKAGDEHHPNVRGMRYRDIKRWADLPLPDKRTRPLSEKKVMRAYRLRPNVLAKLAKLAKNSNSSETETLEQLIQTATIN